MTEQEQQELQQQAEYGRKAKIVKEFMQSFITTQRVQIINALETEDFDTLERKAISYIKGLRLLRNFDLLTERYIDEGKIAEEELSKNGNS